MSVEKDPRPSGQHVAASKAYVKALLPALRYLAHGCGYALTTHGTMRRDIDLVAVPWRDGAVSAQVTSFEPAIAAA